MTPTKEDSSNGYPRYNGWQRWGMEIGRTFGVPTVLLLLISYWLLWQVTPPIVAAMSQFLSSTMETQKELARTQSDIAESQRKLVILIQDVQKAATEIVIAEQSTQAFMVQAEATHKIQLEKLERIEQAVVKCGSSPSKPKD